VAQLGAQYEKIEPDRERYEQERRDLLPTQRRDAATERWLQRAAVGSPVMVTVASCEVSGPRLL
jgi:hypothetical protein